MLFKVERLEFGERLKPSRLTWPFKTHDGKKSRSFKSYADALRETERVNEQGYDKVGAKTCFNDLLHGLRLIGT